MKNILIASLLMASIFTSTTSFAQTSAKSAYFELGGAGLATINYDMRFQKKEGGIGGKIGIGGFSIDGTSALFVPIGLNYLLGKDERNFFEVGLGVTIVSISDQFLTEDDGNFNSTFGHAFFGYRLQPKNGGFLFRAGITPIFTKDGFVPYWAGISFGYKF